MRIKELKVTQVRIFPLDYIPYAYLMRSDFIEHMKGEYKFRKHEMPFEFFQEGVPNILGFLGGRYVFEEKKIIITRLHFDNRRIIFEVSSPTEIANRIFAAIIEDIKQFEPAGTFEVSNLSFQSEETSCLLTLDVDFMNIYSRKMRTFIKKSFTPLLKNKYLEIRPKSMSFEVDFEPDKALMKQHRVSLSPKTLVIEPRDGESLDKRIFLTKSPFDSNTHLELLGEFEKTFS